MPTPKQPLFRKPQTIGGVFYFVVLAVGMLALVLIALLDWRIGVRVLGADLIFAGVLRTKFDDYSSGMLRVRKKPSDLLFLFLAGLCLIVLSVTIPNQPN